MSDDEKFGDFLHGAAHDYNAPPVDVPRDEMWAAIRAARRAGAPSAESAAPVALPFGTHVHMKRRQLLVGLAATLLIGVALGRYVLGARDAARPLASATPAEERAPVAPSRCHNRRCINPDHLTIGTRADNKHDDWEYWANGIDGDYLGPVVMQP